MAKNDVYESLLDMYCQRFGVSRVSESLMEVLRLQFTPKEAELAVKVGFKKRTLDEIQESCGIEKESLRKMLNIMADKGTMWIDPGTESPGYKTIGILGPGLLETGGWTNVKFAHSVQLLKALHKFKIDYADQYFATTQKPLVRVWAAPAALPEDAAPEVNIAKIIESAGCWGVGTCPCRLGHWIADPGNHCEHLLETCILLGDMARWGIEHGMCREMTLEETIELLRKTNEDGLVHSGPPDKFICNCCHDCCVVHIAHRDSGGKVFRPSGFTAQIDEQGCIACGICADRCPVGAIEVDDCAAVDVEKCLGCGVCFPTCPTESVSLVVRPELKTT